MHCKVHLLELLRTLCHIRDDTCLSQLLRVLHPDRNRAAPSLARENPACKATRWDGVKESDSTFMATLHVIGHVARTTSPYSLSSHCAATCAHVSFASPCLKGVGSWSAQN